VLDERRHIRCDEILSLPDTDDKRRIAPSSHDHVGLLTVDRYQGERARTAATRASPGEIARGQLSSSRWAAVSVSVSDRISTPCLELRP
jgi:hypothetical protein